MNRRNARNAGVTLAETTVTLMLISIMMIMAASALSSAFRVFSRIQRSQYAQSVVETVMTELKNLTQDAEGYVKIYSASDSQIANNSGSFSGNTLEFLNKEGYVVLLSQQGCQKTSLLVNGEKNGTADEIPAGQLVARYYMREITDKTAGRYQYSHEKVPVARAVTRVYGSGFYMGNYLEITYSLPEDNEGSSMISGIMATVALYSDAACTDKIAMDSEILEFRKEVKCEMGVTATDW